MLNTTLITGASSGIGLELAKVFASNQHNLLLTARREGRLLKLKKELENENDIQIFILPLDLSDNDSPNKLRHFAGKNSLHINILVNNAGIGDYGLFHESDWDKQKTMIDLNIKSLTHLTHLFLPDMIKKKRGYILNVASTAAFQPGPLMSVYYATKHYVLAFSEAISNEVKGTGVSVTALCPGPTKSEFQETADMEKSRLVNTFPLPSAKQVAEYGYKSMKKGKRVAVHGYMNKIFSVAVRLFPKKLVTTTVRWLQSSV